MRNLLQRSIGKKDAEKKLPKKRLDDFSENNHFFGIFKIPKIRKKGS